MKLRDYQERIIEKTINELKKGKRHVLINLPTGAGKTAVSSELVRRCFEKGKRSIFCCHRQELLKQTYKTYTKNGLAPSFIKSGMSSDPSNPCQIALINTLSKRLDKYPDVDFLVVDEAHHQSCTTWAKVADRYKNAVIIGLSATPCRLDGKPLSGYFDSMVSEISTKDLIKQGYLVPFQYYAPSILDERELVIGSNGEYTKESVYKTVEGSQVIGNNIKTYKELAFGKRNVVFAVNREHGKRVCDEYNLAGIKAEFVDGTTANAERNAALERFDKGETKVLVNVDLFGEGFDLPAIEVVSLLRPTHSVALYLQQVGRALRPCPELGKTQAIILDHVNNYKRHGFPDDIREWSLDGKVKNKTEDRDGVVSIKRCPVCFFAHKPALKCPNCGHVYESDGRTIEEINGKLVLIGSSEERKEKYNEVLLVKDLSDLIRIEKKRGYKFGWAEIQWKIKTGEDLRMSYTGLKKIEEARGYRNGWAFMMKMKRKGY